MDLSPAFVGIDVAKHQLDIHIKPSAETFTLERDNAGLDQLISRLQALKPSLVVLEATGGRG